MCLAKMVSSYSCWAMYQQLELSTLCTACYVTRPLFVYTIAGHLACFQVWIIMNKVDMKILILVIFIHLHLDFS